MADDMARQPAAPHWVSPASHADTTTPPTYPAPPAVHQPAAAPPAYAAYQGPADAVDEAAVVSTGGAPAGDDVLELVLTDEHEVIDAGSARAPGPRAARVAGAGTSALSRLRFLVPEQPAWAIIGLVAAVVGLLDPWFGSTIGWSAGLGTKITNPNSPFGPDWAQMKDIAVTQLVFSASGLAIALGSALLWRPDRHPSWSRGIAQVTLVVSLVGVVLAVLFLTGTVGALPTVNPSGPGGGF
jgi:hypothetical protein